MRRGSTASSLSKGSEAGSQRRLAPLRKLLLIGPPGTGKTTTAAVLAAGAGPVTFHDSTSWTDHEIPWRDGGQAPPYLRRDSGDAGRLLVRRVRCAGRQADDQERGRRDRRVLNSFLQFLEQDASDSILVAATNHPKLLDRALSEGSTRWLNPTSHSRGCGTGDARSTGTPGHVQRRVVEGGRSGPGA